MKILLITSDGEIIKKMSGILSSGGIPGKHQLRLLAEPPADSDASVEDDFIIVDLCTDPEKNNKLSIFLKSTAAVDLPKFLIVDASNIKKIESIYKQPVKVNDFVFKENLDAELGIRIGNIFSRDFKLKPLNGIAVANMFLDLDKYELLINGKKIELTFKEYELLKILLENKNKVFTRTQLLSAVWDYDYYGGSRTVDVHMRRLRSKMDLPYSEMLKTIRNVGYMFSPDK